MTVPLTTPPSGLWVSGTPSPSPKRERRGLPVVTRDVLPVGPQSGTDSSASARKGRHVISVRRHRRPRKSSEHNAQLVKREKAQEPRCARSERRRGAVGSYRVVAATTGIRAGS